MSETPVLTIKNLSLDYHGFSVANGISLSVAPGELVAVMGPNGCGKSTLLTLIYSLANSRTGSLARIGLGHKGHINLHEKASCFLLPQKAMTTEELLREAANPFVLRIAARLNMSLKEINPEQLSDGQRQKLSLAAALGSEADLTLLDEPTNFLDLAGVDGFEQLVSEAQAQGRAFLLVTHDRAVADHLADRTILLTRHGNYVTSGGYSAAWSLKRADFQSRRHQAAEIRKKIEHLQTDARRRAGWAANKERSKRGAGAAKPHIAKMARKMASRAKAVEQRAAQATRELEETKPYVPKTVNLKIEPYDVRRRTVVRLDKATFDYARKSSRPLLDRISMELTTADKTCLMGENGSGKTTLLKILLGRIAPLSGSVLKNYNVPIAYLPQGLKGVFARGSLLDNMLTDRHGETTVRQHLGAALLRRDKVHQPVERFSPGELMRAAVVRCILDRAEFMILDEPTTNLDVESIEVMERLLDDFPGGYLLISHDRAFVQNTVRQLMRLDQGRLKLV